MQVLSTRQRVAAASLFKRRPTVLAEAGAMVDEATYGEGYSEAYSLWYELVCSEMQRLGVLDPGQVREFCDRAGVPTDEGVPLRVAPATAA